MRAMDFFAALLVLLCGIAAIGAGVAKGLRAPIPVVEVDAGRIYDGGTVTAIRVGGFYLPRRNQPELTAGSPEGRVLFTVYRDGGTDALPFLGVIRIEDPSVVVYGADGGVMR